MLLYTAALKPSTTIGTLSNLDNILPVVRGGNLTARRIHPHYRDIPTR